MTPTTRSLVSLELKTPDPGLGLMLQNHSVSRLSHASSLDIPCNLIVGLLLPASLLIDCRCRAVASNILELETLHPGGGARFVCSQCRSYTKHLFGDGRGRGNPGPATIM